MLSLLLSNKKPKLFKSQFLSKDPNKIKTYKIYCNKLNRIKEAAKKKYFRAQFCVNSENLKTIWKLIGMLTNRKKSNTQPVITKLLHNNKSYTDRANIAHQLNTYFINVGNNLSENLPQPDISPNECINQSLSKQFYVS